MHVGSSADLAEVLVPARFLLGDCPDYRQEALVCPIPAGQDPLDWELVSELTRRAMPAEGSDDRRPKVMVSRPT